MSIAQLLDSTLTYWMEFSFWLMGFFVVFTLMARIMPCNPGQPTFRYDTLTDILYGLIIPVITRLVHIVYITLGISIIFYGQSFEEVGAYIQNGYGPLSAMPLWLQAATVFVLSDIILYWTHRGFHGRRMWRFHAIHHSPEHVDWLSTFRFHPVNTWLSFTLVDSAMLLAGFSPAAISLMASFNMIYSAMVHANLNWTFGPFKYIFASPVFHRWHHTAQEEGMDKNFAPTFPLLDIMFGTFYMPENTVPQTYGVKGSDIPKTFVGQLLWPFKQR